MSMRWTDKTHKYDAVMVKWETQEAEFLQLEITPHHIIRIKIDRKITK